eukprot:gene19453-25335_t
MPTSQPTTNPSSLPTGEPTSQPSSQPSNRPSSIPTSLPTPHPTLAPTLSPTGGPTIDPSFSPTLHPSGLPTSFPSNHPNGPTFGPTTIPTGLPTSQPTSFPSRRPSGSPTTLPSSQPSSDPSSLPTSFPTSIPTNQPTNQPTATPSAQPTNQPTAIPSNSPSSLPTSQPTCFPSGIPTSQPSSQPTAKPTKKPTHHPTFLPTFSPTLEPTMKPTVAPTCFPTYLPSAEPTHNKKRDPEPEFKKWINVYDDQDKTPNFVNRWYAAKAKKDGNVDNKVPRPPRRGSIVMIMADMFGYGKKDDEMSLTSNEMKESNIELSSLPPINSSEGLSNDSVAYSNISSFINIFRKKSISIEPEILHAITAPSENMEYDNPMRPQSITDPKRTSSSRRKSSVDESVKIRKPIRAVSGPSPTPLLKPPQSYQSRNPLRSRRFSRKLSNADLSNTTTADSDVTNQSIDIPTNVPFQSSDSNDDTVVDSNVNLSLDDEMKEENKIIELSNELRESDINTLINGVNWDSSGWHYNKDASINVNGLEYDTLAISLKDQLDKDINSFNADRLSTLTEDDFNSWFPNNKQLPNSIERVRVLNELGQVLLDEFDGLASNLVKLADHSASNLVYLLLRYLPGFRDISIYKGKRVEFYKRAQILVGDVWAAYGRQINPSEPYSFYDIDQLTMFADYRVPQILRHLNILQYNKSLSDKIDSYIELPFGSEEEIEIRALTIIAVDKLHQRLIEAGINIKVIELDWLLWQKGELIKDNIKPAHRTLTIFY